MEFVSTANAAASPGSTSMDSAPTSKGSAPPAPLERAASSLGMLMKRTETAEHPCIPMFFFTLDGEANPVARATVQIDNLPYFGVYRDGAFVEGFSTTKEDVFRETVTRHLGTNE